jgi:amidase
VDAPQVERLRAAGAIPLGRTNLPDFGLRVHTDSALHGLTRNPWDPRRTPGGSSGGEAAALATGMSPLGLGNDLGGSLRNPAHCCGVASIKPSAGAVPAATVIPPEDWNLSFQLMAVEGVMARRVADVRAGFTAIAGQHPRDPLSVPAVFTDLSPGEPPRIAVLPEPPGGSTHPGVAAAVRRAADALADDGFEVTEAVPPDYEQAIELWGTILAADLGIMKPLLDQIMGEGARQFLGYALEHLAVSDLGGWAAANTARHGVARRWSLWYQEYPVLLCPVWSQPAFLLDFDISSLGNAIATLELMRPVLPANLLGTPAAVVPAGMADGLPVGVQVMGARYTDLRCLAIAEMIEQRLGTLTPIDPVAGSPDR